VFLDGGGNVLRPALLWCDGAHRRGVRGDNALVGGESRLYEYRPAGLASFTAPKSSGCESMSLRLREVVHVCAKDYIRYKLTGEFATEVSDASGTRS
jgi:xylulokinase